MKHEQVAKDQQKLVEKLAQLGITEYHALGTFNASSAVFLYNSDGLQEAYTGFDNPDYEEWLKDNFAQ